MCRKFEGIAIKKLIDSIPDEINNEKILNKVLALIPLSFFPLTIVCPEWKCLGNLRKESQYSSKSKVNFISTVIFPRTMFRTFSIKYEAMRVLKVVKKMKKVDLLHCHTAMDGYAGKVIYEKLGIPYVVTVRREIDFDGNNLNEKEKLLILDVIKKATLVIAPSAHLKKKCIKYAGRNAILVPNGIDASNISSESVLLRRNKNEVNITTIATLDRNKRIDLVINTFSKVANTTNYDMNLHIIGDGPLRAKLEMIAAEHKIGNKIHFYGKLSHSDVINILREKTDIFFLPSRTETFGLVYLEALAQGVPIIGTKNQGIDGIAKNKIHGFFCENKEEFYEALYTLVTNPKMRLNMGLNGLKLAKDVTWRRSGEKLVKIYLKLKNETK